MASTIEDAVKNARYNEAVVVTVSNEENNEKREIVLVATLDTKNGGVSWQDAGAAQSRTHNLNIHAHALEASDIGIQRHLRTKSWINPMLNDEHRNSLYASSIRKACATVIQNLNRRNQDCKEKETVKVLDIGSGTGLLAMLAAQSVQQAGLNPQVTSIEMASAMARLARKVVKSNDLGRNIDIIEGHSCNENFNPYPKDNKAMLCTSELLETGLLGEGIIPAMRDAWVRHLAHDAVVVPQRARVYAQIIEGRSFVNHYCGPHYDIPVRLSTKGGAGQKSFLLGGKGGGVRVPIHAEALFENTDSSSFCSPADDSSERADCATALSESTLVLEFDFTSKDAIPLSSGRIVEKELTAVKSGVAHGVLFHWELDLWEGETYSTEVGKSPWQDHWQQCLYVFADDHDNCERLTQDQPFTLVASHDDTSISFKISAKTSFDHQVPKKQRVEENKAIAHAFENHISYGRALQLNDKDRMSVLHASIESAIQRKGKHSVILDISDFSLCAIIAARAFGAEKVTSLESSSNGVPYLSALVAQAGNQLPCEGCSFQVINAYAENLTTDHLGGEVDIVMAEPYYEILESWHLQEALNYYYLLRYLKQKGLVKNDAISLPTCASVIACAVQLDESVARAHSGLQMSSLCGFSHEQVTQNGSLPSTYDMKMSAFQYKWKRLSRDFCIAKLQYDGPLTHMIISGDGEWSESAELDLGDCHGIFMWVEYEYGLSGTTKSKSIISTGNRYHQQAFRFLDRSVTVQEGDRIFVKPSFNTETIEDHEIEMTVRRR